MGKSTSDFNERLDPFSATFTALTTGQPSWSGGYKCITINGLPALEYLETSQMDWKDYYHFMRGKGDFAPSKIAEVLQDDKVMAGIRRRFFSSSAEAPSRKEDVRKIIEQNVQAVLTKAALSNKAKEIVLHMVGNPSSARTKATQEVAFQNLFSTDAAMKDIAWIVDAAAKASDLMESKEYVEEIFSYALPDEEASPYVDEQIERGMSILLEKDLSVMDLFQLFEKGYSVGASNGEKMARFLPLFLRSLTRTDYPLQHLESLPKLLRSKFTLDIDMDNALKLLEQLVGEMKDKKTQEDACFVAVPLFYILCEKFPAKDEHFDQFKKKLEQLVAIYQAPADTNSTHGLRGMATLLVGEDRIVPEFMHFIRPKSYRDTKDDFSLVFHRMVKAADPKYSSEPEKVLLSALQFLKEDWVGIEYSPVIEDLEVLLTQLKPEPIVISKLLIPLLEEIRPKKGQKPSISLEDAQSIVADVLLLTVHNENFSNLLKTDVVSKNKDEIKRRAVDRIEGLRQPMLKEIREIKRENVATEGLVYRAAFAQVSSQLFGITKERFNAGLIPRVKSIFSSEQEQEMFEEVKKVPADFSLSFGKQVLRFL